MSWRRLRVLLDHLPSESAYLTAVREAMRPEDWKSLEDDDRPAQHGPWSRADHLLATIVDRLAWLTWLQTDGSGPTPQPYPRPGVDLSNVRGINPETERRLAYLREVERLHGAQPAPDWDTKEAT